eukprot:Pgem_evm1s3008
MLKALSLVTTFMGASFAASVSETISPTNCTCGVDCPPTITIQYGNTCYDLFNANPNISKIDNCQNYPNDGCIKDENGNWVTYTLHGEEICDIYYNCSVHPPPDNNTITIQQGDTCYNLFQSNPDYVEINNCYLGDQHRENDGCIKNPDGSWEVFSLTAGEVCDLHTSPVEEYHCEANPYHSPVVSDAWCQTVNQCVDVNGQSNNNDNQCDYTGNGSEAPRKPCVCTPM